VHGYESYLSEFSFLNRFLLLRLLSKRHYAELGIRPAVDCKAAVLGWRYFGCKRAANFLRAGYCQVGGEARSIRGESRPATLVMTVTDF